MAEHERNQGADRSRGGRSAGRGFEGHAGERRREPRSTGGAYWDRDQQNAGVRGEHGEFDGRRRGMHYGSSQQNDFREDERRFGRQSDYGIRGERGSDLHGGGREASTVQGASGHAYGMPHQARQGRSRLGPYQDSFELGTGRHGRGLEEDGAGARGRAGGGYAAVAGGPYVAESRRGRGPRNYRRSDQRIREDVCERLTEDDDIDASDIEVQVLDGTVTLVGTVDERWEKHRAEDLADACSGVREVENRIRVARREQYGGTGAGGASASQPAGGQGEEPAPGTTRADQGEIGNSG